MPIAEEIVRHTLEVAQAHRATRVVSVEVEVGALRLVAPEALTLLFAAASEGTFAEGAVLRIAEAKAEGVCRACGRRYEPGILDFVCPRCGKADAEIAAGNDIVLRSVELDVPETDAPDDVRDDVPDN